ncbi:hypothetical protein MPSEU_000113800 [Mayamaea pseudoterrestris]|nr:hypothetical protein MPSEU_000113800 [Mayamaea pseudoterrestris]
MSWVGHARLAQRYIVALFYWSLAPRNAEDNSNEAPKYVRRDASECDWAGFRCAEIEHGQIFTVITARAQHFGTPTTRAKPPFSATAARLVHERLTGSIIGDFFYSWIELYLLDLSGNKLSGTLRASLWALEELHYQYLNENSFSGIIDDSLLVNRSSKLVEVWIHDNGLSGSLPGSLPTVIVSDV